MVLLLKAGSKGVPTLLQVRLLVACCEALIVLVGGDGEVDRE